MRHLLKILQRMFQKDIEIEAALDLPGRGRGTPKKVPKGEYRMVRTSRGGINMPKRQTCPMCHSSSKRQSKTLGGANYRCLKHGAFFVRGSFW